jgi:hypothetical protein
MPTAETLRALLALVEEAKAGSRELDEAIHGALLPDDPWWQAIVEGRRLVAAGQEDTKIDACNCNLRADSWAVSAQVKEYSTSVDKARALAAKLLPDFWMSSGLCSLTGHASIGPDYNGPAGDRLRSEWPEADFHSGFDADLKPGDGPHRECYAILSCMLQGLLAKEELAAGRSALSTTTKGEGHE